MLLLARYAAIITIILIEIEKAQEKKTITAAVTIGALDVVKKEQKSTLAGS